MIEIKAPGPIPDFPKVRIFLAGSIEMGIAELWQKKIVNAVDDLDVVVLNPRRDNWDSEWEQSANNPLFNEQVTWELNGLENSDIVVFYFDIITKSPITLMELGLIANTHPRRCIVCCPDGFWRKGNVDIVCYRTGITQVDTLDELIKQLRTNIDELLVW